tara:strand:- start:5712 stop:6461 length:750 start_codon:yes stop_codon:yes gene_type:complete
MPKSYLEKNLGDLISSFNFTSSKKFRLIIIFGLLGDFDSFEYGINLSNYLTVNKQKDDLEVFGVAIGNPKGKKKFCEFTNFPEKNLRLVSDNKIHTNLGVHNGLDIGMGGWINMFLMLIGIGSPKTLSEVLRGYIGDRKATQIFNDNDKITLFNSLSFSGKLFKRTFGNGYLRPFELATFRLNNMIEIINSWDDYIIDPKFLPQRTASFLINENNEVVYKYFSKDILNYSNNMSIPLEFLRKILRNDSL